MIRVHKDYAAIPKGLAGQGAERHRARALAEMGGHKFNGEYYGNDTVRKH